MYIINKKTLKQYNWDIHSFIENAVKKFNYFSAI